MLVYRLSIIGLLAVCAALLATRPAPPAPAPIVDRVTAIDATCYYCGSGNGPTSDELASLVDLGADESVVAIDGVATHATAREAFERLGGHRYHGEEIRLAIDGQHGHRDVVLVLH